MLKGTKQHMHKINNLFHYMTNYFTVDQKFAKPVKVRNNNGGSKADCNVVRGKGGGTLDENKQLN